MQRIIIIAFLLIGLTNIASYAQKTRVILGSKNNQFDIKINNTSNKEINGIRIFPGKIPASIELKSSEVSIEKLNPNSSVDAQFYFNVNSNGKLSESETIDFIILTEDGSSWHKKIEYSVISPLSYSLDQNYPNPFNPTTTISYSIPRKAKVKLIVTDILGQNVETLVNEVKNPGIYEVTFNAENLASGIYFYTLNTRDFSKTVKMILLK